MGGGPVAVAVLREPRAAASEESVGGDGAARGLEQVGGRVAREDVTRPVRRGGTWGWDSGLRGGLAGRGGGCGGSTVEEETGSASSSPFIQPCPLQPPAPRTHPWVAQMPAGLQGVPLTLVCPPAFSPPRDHPLHRPSSTFSQPPASLTAAAFLAMKVLHDTVSLAVLLR